jgi:hypothetical protein
MIAGLRRLGFARSRHDHDAPFPYCDAANFHKESPE